MWSRIPDAYRTVDPAKWVGVFRDVPWWLGAVAAVVGVFLLLRGGGPAFRLVASPAGALIGLAFGPMLASRFGIKAPANVVAWSAAAVLGASSFALPHIAVFVAFGIPAGLVAARMAGSGGATLGFLIGFFVVGAVGALLTRIVACIAASAAGAWLLVIGLLAVAHRHSPGLTAIAKQPWRVLAVAGLIAAAAAAYQLFSRRPPRERPPTADEIIRAREDAERRQAL